MHNFRTPSAPYQSNMHSFRPGAPSKARTTLSTQFAPYQTNMHQSSPSATPHARTSLSNPFQANRSTFIHSYTHQHSSISSAPPNLGNNTQNPSAPLVKQNHLESRCTTQLQLKQLRSKVEKEKGGHIRDFECF